MKWMKACMRCWLTILEATQDLAREVLVVALKEKGSSVPRRRSKISGKAPNESTHMVPMIGTGGIRRIIIRKITGAQGNIGADEGNTMTRPAQVQAVMTTALQSLIETQKN